MDAGALKAVIDAALEAQRAMFAAEENEKAAREAAQRAQESYRYEYGRLAAALSGGAAAIYGDRIVSINPIHHHSISIAPLVSIPVAVPVPAAPPPPPAVVVPPAPVVEPPKPVVPVSGGVIPKPQQKPAAGAK